MVQSKFNPLNNFSTNDNVDVGENRNSYVFKKIINPAVYVEKTIDKMTPTYRNYQNLANTIRIMKTKRCSCSINRENCPFHRQDEMIETENETQEKPFRPRLLTSKLPNYQPKIMKPGVFRKTSSAKPVELISTNETETRTHEITCSPKSEFPENQEIVSSSSSSTSTFSTSSQVTVKRSNKAFQCDSKLSLSSLTSFTLSENESVRHWLNKKLEEQKKRQLERQKEEEQKEVERQKLLEKERENFKLWLATKKRKEEKQKAELKRKQRIEQLKELEKEKRNLENQINFQIWLKRKEVENLDKKTQQQLKVLESKIEKEKKSLESQKAFQEWLESSKSKPKPIPFSKGLDSLRSSVSVTYVNPVPWVPNIEYKPVSQ